MIRFLSSELRATMRRTQFPGVPDRYFNYRGGEPLGFKRTTSLYESGALQGPNVTGTLVETALTQLAQDGFKAIGFDYEFDHPYTNRDGTSTTTGQLLRRFAGSDAAVQAGADILWDITNVMSTVRALFPNSNIETFHYSAPLPFEPYIGVVAYANDYANITLPALTTSGFDSVERFLDGRYSSSLQAYFLSYTGNFDTSLAALIDCYAQHIALWRAHYGGAISSLKLTLWVADVIYNPSNMAPIRYMTDVELRKYLRALSELFGPTAVLMFWDSGTGLAPAPGITPAMKLLFDVATTKALF